MTGRGRRVWAMAWAMTWAMVWLLACMPTWASAAVLTHVSVDDEARDSGQVYLDLQFFGHVPEVTGYRLDAPPRLTFDLPATSSGLGQRRMEIARGGVEQVTAIEAGGRTRLVVTLSERYDYTTQASDGRLRIALSPSTAEPVPSEPEALATVQGPQIEDIDFRRSAEGAGTLEVSFNRRTVSPRIQERDGRVIVSLRDVAIPDTLNQIYDVTDFGTPITRIVPQSSVRGTQLALETQGPYAMVSSQQGQTLTVEVQPVREPETAPEEERLSQEDTYEGEPLSLHFQDIEVRAALDQLASFTGLNIVVSDGASGRVTLNLNEVPWDQAFDLILQSQQLSSRRRGNVIVVAPASELAELERQELEARNQRQTLSPLVTEFFKVKYARAADLVALLRNDESGFGLLTERGRVSADPRTNTLLIQDTREQLEQVLATLERLDVSVRQVQIEARIVIARDNASRELGINWNTSGNRDVRGIFGSSTSDQLSLEGASTGLSPPNGGLAVDFGSSAENPTTFAFGYLSGDILLDLELSALESEGKSQTISQPRIITADQRPATISQGEERIFQTTTIADDGTREPVVATADALLSLEVTPQITPDNRIIMELSISNDSFLGDGQGAEVPIGTNTIETQVLVDNGQTVVLGGVLTTEMLESVNKTPFLGDLPLIGRLFRYNSESNNKVELLVFITPRILDDDLVVR